VNKFGLKDKFDFMEVTVGRINAADIQYSFSVYVDILRNKIAPAIEALEKDELIDGFHFISHEGVDLRLSCPNWKLSEIYKIKKILKLNGIDGDLHPYNDLNGSLDSIVKANFLETVSRCVLAEVLAEGKSSRENLSHYLNNQYGVWNIDEAIDHFHRGQLQIVISLFHQQISVDIFKDLMKLHKKKIKGLLKASRTRKLSERIGSSHINSERKEGVNWFLKKAGIKANI